MPPTFARNTFLGFISGVAVALAGFMGSAVAARLLGDRGERERMRENAQTFIAAHRGAIDRLWAWLEPRLAVADAKANRSTAD